jgi:hypothetical protein
MKRDPIYRKTSPRALVYPQTPDLSNPGRFIVTFSRSISELAAH